MQREIVKSKEMGNNSISNFEAKTTTKHLIIEKKYIFFLSRIRWEEKTDRHSISYSIDVEKNCKIETKEVEGNDSISNFEAEKAKQRWRKWFIWRRPLIPDV